MALHTILFLSLLFSMMPLFRAECQDEGITLSFTNPLYRVNENNGPAQPVLVLSDPIDCCSTISVWVDIMDMTAKEGEDYTVKSPTQVLIPGGHTRATFDVRIVDNVILEDSEKFIVSIDPLSLPYGVVLGDHATAEVVIMDNDVTTVSFETTQYEFEEGDGSVEVTLSLSQPVPFNTSLELQTIDDTTTSRCDYEPGPYNVPIPTGVTTFTYNFSILDDDVYEIDEEFTLEIHSSPHGQVRINQRMDTTTITIKDDEEPIYVSFDEPMYIVNERDGVVSPVITLSKPTPCCLNLYVEVEDITANRGDDYGDTSTMQYLVTFPAGTNCSSFDIPIINDTLSEDDESFRITILEMSLPFGTMLGDSDTDSNTTEVVIVDNDMYLSFSNATYSVFEDEGFLCINLTLDKPSLVDTTVEVNEFNSSATAGGVDYESGPYFVNLTKGDTTAEICIGITDDNILEVIMVDPEIFILRINTITLHPEIIPKPPDSAIVNIRDDEYTFNFNQSIYVVQENDSGVTVTLEFSIDLRNDTIVQFRYTNLSAIGNDTIGNESETVDYYTAFAWPYYAIVPMGSNSYTFNIAIFDDETLEDNELFRIYVEEPMRANGVMPVQADIIIMNDDDFDIGFDFPSYSIGKNDPETPIILFYEFPGEYNYSMFFPVKVIIQQVNGTAIGGYEEGNGVDFVVQDNSYTFNFTNQTHRVLLRPIDDNIVEPDEYFTLVFTLEGNRDHFEIVHQTVNVTIENDDVCIVRIREQNGRDTLYFSKQLATNITVVITYQDGTQSETEEFTAEETKTRNNFPLPNNFRHITVEIPEKFMRSKRTNVKVDPEEHRIAIKPV